VRVFKQHRRGGKTKNWYVEVSLGDARHPRLPAFRDKAASEEFARMVEQLAELRSRRARPDAELSKRVEGLPPKMRVRLVNLRLLDPTRSTSTKTLAQHIEDYRQALIARGNSAPHCDASRGFVLRVFNGCGFVYWSDIDHQKVEQYLRGLREHGDMTTARVATKSKPARVPRPIGATTSNQLLTAAKSFCKWMVDSLLASESPLRGLKPLNAKLDRRHERRALTVDELRALLTTTVREPERYGMSGMERATLYRLAVETGLRASEVASLTVASFRGLASDSPEAATVSVRASASKNRRDCTLPLRSGTAAALREHFRRKTPSARAFNTPEHWRSADMIHADLAAAGVLKRNNKTRQVSNRDEEGFPVDFHTLRHTMISNLAHAGVEPKTAQTLARHSTITLTLDRYTHVHMGDSRRAIESLPDLDVAPVEKTTPPVAPESQLALKNGSDDSDDLSEVERYRERYRLDCNNEDASRDSMRLLGPENPQGDAQHDLFEAVGSVRNPMLYPAELRARAE